MTWQILSNATSFMDIFTYVNTLSGGWLPLGILLLVFIMAFVATAIYNSSKGLTIGLAAAAVVGLPLVLAGWLSIGIELVLIVMAALSAIIIR